MQESQKMWVRSLGWEDPLEEGMAPTPVFLPGESQGQRSLADHNPWDPEQSDTAVIQHSIIPHCMCVCVYHILYPLVCRGHLGCVHALETVEKAAMNIVYVFK